MSSIKDEEFTGREYPLSGNKIMDKEMMQLYNGVGKKYDDGKPLMGCIPPHAELAVARVLTMGAAKYGRDNWRFVANPMERYMDAALRHINAFRSGEPYDAESEESHLAHAVCCLMFILELTDCDGDSE